MLNRDDIVHAGHIRYVLNNTVVDSSNALTGIRLNINALIFNKNPFKNRVWFSTKMVRNKASAYWPGQVSS